MNADELNTILDNHARWLRNEECFLANLQYANLQKADLRNANLENANLWNANLQYANLQYANLQKADLQKADLQYANLQKANLQYANLQYANLQYANLQKADLRNANLSWNSHALLSEILWRAADTEARQMLAAFVGRKVEWCWKDWNQFRHPEYDWAVSELAKWIKEGDTAPKWLRRIDRANRAIVLE